MIAKKMGAPSQNCSHFTHPLKNLRRIYCDNLPNLWVSPLIQPTLKISLPYPISWIWKRETQNVFNGQIQSLVFIGEAFEGEITINDTQLFVKTEPDSDIKVRDTANFTVDPDHCLLITR